MQLQDVYPIIVTEHVVRCRDFYRRWFELEVLFEASWVRPRRRRRMRRVHERHGRAA